MACFQSIQLTLPSEDVELLEQLADKMGTTQAAVVRAALKLLQSQQKTIEQAGSTNSTAWMKCE